MKNKCPEGGDLVSPVDPRYSEMKKTKRSDSRVKCQYCGKHVLTRSPLNSAWGCMALMIPQHNMLNDPTKEI